MAGKNSIFDFMDDSPFGDWMAERNADIFSFQLINSLTRESATRFIQSKKGKAKGFLKNIPRRGAPSDSIHLGGDLYIKISWTRKIQ